MHAPRSAGVDSVVGAAALCVLVAQMSGLTLAMHASRTFSDAKYLVSAAVLLTELLKLAACVAFAALRAPLAAALGVAHLAPAPHAGVADWLAAAADGAAAVVRGAGAVAVPAVLFTLAQQLNLYAATELDAVTFQVTNQLKILPTAAFSVVALNRALRPQQWLSLPLLALGVAVVNLSASAHAPRQRLGDASEAAVLAAAGGAGVAARLRWWAGLSAALAAALCSGYSSVAVERMLKMEERAAAASDSADGASSAKAAHLLEEGAAPLPAKGSDASSSSQAGEEPLPLSAPGGDACAAPEPPRGRPLLTLNLQLAGWGALISAIQLLFFNAGALRGAGLTAHFNAFTWAVILLQALGGLVVGVVLKYTDNIVKGFATAASILLSFVLESIAAGRRPTLAFVFGLALVVASFALFSGPEELLSRVLGPRGYALAAAAAADTAAAAVACARGACSPAAPPARAGALLLAAAGVAGCLAVTALYLHDAPQAAAAPSPPLLLASATAAVLQRNASAAPQLALPAAGGALLSSEAGGAGLGGGASSAASADYYAADYDYAMRAPPDLATLQEASAQRLRVPGDPPAGEAAAASAFATEATLLPDSFGAEQGPNDDSGEVASDWASDSTLTVEGAANSSMARGSSALASPPLLVERDRRREKGVMVNGSATTLLPSRLEGDAAAELAATRAARDDAARSAAEPTQRRERSAEREALPRAQALVAAATDQGGAVLASAGAA